MYQEYGHKLRRKSHRTKRIAGGRRRSQRKKSMQNSRQRSRQYKRRSKRQNKMRGGNVNSKTHKKSKPKHLSKAEYDLLNYGSPYGVTPYMAASFLSPYSLWSSECSPCDLQNAQKINNCPQSYLTFCPSYLYGGKKSRKKSQKKSRKNSRRQSRKNSRRKSRR